MIQKHNGIFTTLFVPITKYIESSSSQNITTMLSKISNEQAFSTKPVHLRISGLTRADDERPITVFPAGTKIRLLGRK